MTQALLPVGACSETLWADGTNYNVSLNHIQYSSTQNLTLVFDNSHVFTDFIRVPDQRSRIFCE